MTEAVQQYGRTDTLTLVPKNYVSREYSRKAYPVKEALSNFTYDGLIPPEGAVYPWKTIPELAEEEDEIPEMGLCNEEMLQFLSQSYEEECKKFIDLIPEKVSKGLMKAHQAKGCADRSSSHDRWQPFAALHLKVFPQFGECGL